jgi:EAL and modified HD-GYP domain-containing signal transduction protein
MFSTLFGKEAKTAATQEPPTAPRNDDKPKGYARSVDTGSLDGKHITEVLPVETQGVSVTEGGLMRRYILREPILSTNQGIVGYDLRLRDDEGDAHRDATLRRMDDEMLLGAMESLTQGEGFEQPAVFITISALTLLDPDLTQFPRERLVLGVAPEDQENPELESRIRELAASGYRFLLDDFDPDRPSQLLPLSAYLRIDLRHHDVVALGPKLAGLQLDRQQIIARHVDTDEAYEASKSMAFSLNQGYYFTQPRAGMPAKLTSDHVRVIDLLNKVVQKAEVSELEAVFKQDPALSYKLLRYINSPGVGMLQTIRSLAHAIVILGYDQLYRWLTLLLFSTGHPDARSQTLLRHALVRARLMETLGKKRLAAPGPESLFIVGMFSLLDALLNMPMVEIVGRMRLAEPILEALEFRAGAYAPYLELATACERDDHALMEEWAQACMFEANEVNIAHLEAMVWAEQIDL